LFNRYTAPDGSVIKVKYVADENGFQAESPAIPVAPAFPHEIPDFVLEQIARAAEEDKAAAEAKAKKKMQTPSQLYDAPDPSPTTPSSIYSAPHA